MQGPAFTRSPRTINPCRQHRLKHVCASWAGVDDFFSLLQYGISPFLRPPCGGSGVRRPSRCFLACPWKLEGSSISLHPHQPWSACGPTLSTLPITVGGVRSKSGQARTRRRTASGKLAASPLLKRTHLFGGASSPRHRAPGRNERWRGGQLGGHSAETHTHTHTPLLSDGGHAQHLRAAVTI